MTEDAVPARRTAAALFGADAALLSHTQAFADLLGLGEGTIYPGRGLDELLAALWESHPSVTRIPPSRLRCRTAAGRTIDVTHEDFTDGHCCLVVTDVTEECRLEGELRAARLVAGNARDAKARFLTTVSHELRTPLNAVIGFSDALNHAATTGPHSIDADRIAEFSTAIQHSGEHLLQLVNNMLDLTRLDGEETRMASAAIELSHMLEGCMRAVARDAAEAQVSVELAIADDMPRMVGDERRLRLAIRHLLENAIKFTPPLGRIVLSATLATDGSLEISVTDSGIGMPPESVAQATEPFEQLDSGLNRRASGLGLGLTYCRTLAHAHSGELLLQSEPGVGTTATIRLPSSRLRSASHPLTIIQDPL